MVSWVVDISVYLVFKKPELELFYNRLHQEGDLIELICIIQVESPRLVGPIV